MSDAPTSSARLCPSGRSVEGARLLGILGPGGRVVYTPSSPPMTADQAATFEAAGGSRRFRFAEACIESGCGNWSGGGCGVARAAVALPVADRAELPRCSIRHDCRWFAQEGPAACGRCPYVTREEMRVEP